MVDQPDQPIPPVAAGVAPAGQDKHRKSRDDDYPSAMKAADPAKEQKPLSQDKKDAFSAPEKMDLSDIKKTAGSFPMGGKKS